MQPCWPEFSTTLLACSAYGALFLLFGLLFRNPILPMAAVLAWECLHFPFLVPPALASDECALYLGALTSAPVPVLDGPITILAMSRSPWVAVFSLFALAAVGLALGTWRLRRLEVRYTED